jgi:hypothetical protein
MFHQIKTVHLTETGDEVAEFWGTKEDPADFADIALQMISRHPHGLIEIRYVR